MYSVFLASCEEEHAFVSGMPTQELAIADTLRRAKASGILPNDGQVYLVPADSSVECEFVWVPEGVTLDEVLEGETDEGFFIDANEYVLGDRVPSYEARP